jgi:hypothetical protein
MALYNTLNRKLVQVSINMEIYGSSDVEIE